MLGALTPRRRGGFTLVELMIGIALVAVILTLAAPAFYDFILVQRLKSINSALVTDLQNARAEAATRGAFLRIVFRADDTQTCYTLYTLNYGGSTSSRCNCLLGAGAACTTGDTREVRTVQVLKSTGVQVSPTAGVTAFAFDNLTGSLWSIPSDLAAVPVDSIVIEAKLDDARILRTTINRSGRPSVCGTRSGLAFATC